MSGCVSEVEAIGKLLLRDFFLLLSDFGVRMFWGWRIR